MILDLQTDMSDSHTCLDLKSDFLQIIVMAVRSWFATSANWYHFHLFPSIYISFLFKKGVFSIHEHNTWNRRRKYKFFKLVDGLVYGRAAFIVCITEAVSESLRNWLGDRLEVVVFNNFIGKNYASEKLVNPCNVPFAVMVGSFSAQKRQLELVKAWSNNNLNLMLFLLGDGPNKNIVEEYIAQNSIENIICLGIANPKPYYKFCKVNILMSNWEGFGNVVIEAASFSKPTIGSNVDGLKEIILPTYLVDNEQECIELLKKCSFEGEEVDKFTEDLVKKYTIKGFHKRFSEKVSVWLGQK